MLFETSTIDNWNHTLKKEFAKHNLTNRVVLELHTLQKHAEEQQGFMKGLLLYLKEVDALEAELARFTKFWVSECALCASALLVLVVVLTTSDPACSLVFSGKK